jgi:predicted metal-dependent hydrolase
LYPKELIQYLIHFHGDRDYFECHEILEDYWKRIDKGNKDSIWVGFIQLAVSAYHHRRGNFKGAKRTLEKALTIFRVQSSALTSLGFDKTIFITLLNQRLSAIEKEVAYTSFELPISDLHLLKESKSECKQSGFLWGQKSNLANESLIHRHKLRDRTSVIQDRAHALIERKGNEY